MKLEALEEIATMGARLSQVHAPLYAAYFEYAKPSGSDMRFVRQKLKEAAADLEVLVKFIREWRD